MSSKCAHHLSDLVENRSFPWFLTIIDIWENIVIEKGRQDQERILPGEGEGDERQLVGLQLQNQKIREPDAPVLPHLPRSTSSPSNLLLASSTL